MAYKAIIQLYLIYLAFADWPIDVIKTLKHCVTNITKYTINIIKGFLSVKQKNHNIQYIHISMYCMKVSKQLIIQTSLYFNRPPFCPTPYKNTKMRFRHQPLIPLLSSPPLFYSDETENYVIEGGFQNLVFKIYTKVGSLRVFHGTLLCNPFPILQKNAGPLFSPIIKLRGKQLNLEGSFPFHARNVRIYGTLVYIYLGHYKIFWVIRVIPCTNYYPAVYRFKKIF